MSMSTFQKVTLATCLLLCVGLLLPKMLLSRGRKDAAEEGLGRFPPMLHRQTAGEGRGQRVLGSSGNSRAHNTEAIARAKGAGTGAGAGGKSNLAGQIIPVYGFGILMYILYILFKITSKGNGKPSECRFPSVRSENMKRKITDFELAQLQEKLRETELVMENIVSNAQHSPDRVKGVTAHQEESLLLQLMEITRVMQEGQLVEDTGPKAPPQHGWEDEHEEANAPHWEHTHCHCQQHQDPQEETETVTTVESGLVEDSTEDIECVSKGSVLVPEGRTACTEDEEQPGSHLEFSKEAEHQHWEDQGVPREDQGVPREDQGVPQEDQGVPQEDQGVPQEDQGVPHEDQGVPQEDQGVPQEDQGGDLMELELTERITRVMEKMEDVSSATSCSSVRRRNRKRKSKKSSQ
ncbi:protein RIC-3b [Gouania willdenowi]|uniref:Protein RIC-3-like n=1 Tax=Gouania willdenowi TaxID=441366 RepID=A0A8C5E588_GOUWI|nr:protein RIC-3-like [Gouania willdenowi]